MSEERKFDEAAFDKAVAKPNGWSKVADPVAEIRKMRDGDEAFGKDVLRTSLSLVRAHFDGADDAFLEKSRELAARLDKEGRGDLASFIRAQTGDEPSWVPMERKRRAAPGNAAALREALANVERVAKYCAETPRHTPGYPTDAARADVIYSRIAELGRVARAALAAPARNCDRFATANDAVEGYIAAHPHDDEPDASTYGSWLFAPAKEGKEARRG